MHGIQFWTSAGGSGWLLDVVLLLLPALAGPGRPLHVRAHPYLRPGSDGLSLNSSSSSASSFSLSSDSRLLPHLPPFIYPEDAILPAQEHRAHCDVPLSLYRQLRLQRALGLRGDGPPLLPPPMSYPAPPTSAQGGSRSQFRGDLRIATWNARAFFCEDESRHRVKLRYMKELLEKCDALLVTEAHGRAGRHKAWQAPAGFTAWWSAGPTQGHSGVGIVLRDSFAKQFSSVAWRVLWPGRAARLALRGPDGALDLIVSYFHTGAEIQEADLYGVPDDLRANCHTFSDLRALLRDRISGRVSNVNTVLTILAGDFNWVPTREDRRSCCTSEATGGRDQREEAHFQAVLGARFQLNEMRQPDMTFANSLSRSRLDRVYSNHHIAEQIDRRIHATAMEWKTQVSDHRAVLFTRRAPQHLLEADRRLHLDSIRHPDFQRQVSLEYHHQLHLHPHSSNVGRLRLLKDAMLQVGRTLAGQRERPPEALSQEDRLGVVMRYIRAAEAGVSGIISACLERYPAIKEYVPNPYAPHLHQQGLRALRDHAVELARGHALRELDRAQQLAKEGQQEQCARAKRKATRLLYRLLPGGSADIKAILHPSGALLTEPAAMADALRRHWATVFRARGIHEGLLEQWLQDDLTHRMAHGPHHTPLHRLRMTKKHIATALRCSNNSSPGPDGIPYEAWRIMGKLSVEVLFGAFQDFASDSAEELLSEDYEDFNASILHFLPKKAVGQAEDGSDLYEPGGVRPLNVTNADNRILASATRLLLEPVLGPLITEDQRGFIQGRSMLGNIIDVDEAMLYTAAEDMEGMAFFFDFAAAFPSIEHESFIRFFRSLGWPRWLMNFILTLYRNNKCQMQLGGVRYAGFQITRGIRQGCPLSPLLFAACSDLYLRRLRRTLPGSTIRSYADDLALVTVHVRGKLRLLQQFFSEFEVVSGLGLNFPKTVLVPTDPLTADLAATLREWVGAEAPGWAGVMIAEAAKYLGLYVGPGRAFTSWTAPLQKYNERATLWGKLGVGMFLTLQAYRVYISSVLQFVGQLEDAPPQLSKEEDMAIKKMFRGPKDWVTADCTRELKTLGFGDQLADIHSILTASKARVVRWEAEGCLRIHQRAVLMQRLTCRDDSCTLARLTWLRTWRDRSFILNLFKAAEHVQIWYKANPDHERWHRKVDWQKHATEQVYGPSRAYARLHLDKRLRHWKLALLPGHRLAPALRNLEAIGRRCQPRVWAAVFRLLCNGWCTQSRFGGTGPCRFCGAGEDSIRHLAHCRVVRTQQPLFQAPTSGLQLDTLLGFDGRLGDEQILVVWAHSVYALYRVYNGRRHGRLSLEDVAGAFDEYMRAASRGTAEDDCWRSERI